MRLAVYDRRRQALRAALSVCLDHVFARQWLAGACNIHTSLMAVLAAALPAGVGWVCELSLPIAKWRRCRCVSRIYCLSRDADGAALSFIRPRILVVAALKGRTNRFGAF